MHDAPAKEETVTDRYENLIIEFFCRVIAPIVLLFGVYIVFHGEASPGGGFQGGVILGAGYIMLAIAYGIDFTLKRFREKVILFLSGFGVFIYGGIGAACLLWHGNFLDYGKLPLPLAHSNAIRGLGIMGIEIGVGLTVMGVMVSIYYDLIAAGGVKPEDTGEACDGIFSR